MYDVLYVPVIVVFFNKLLRDKIVVLFNKLLRDKLGRCVECLFRNKLLRDKLERCVECLFRNKRLRDKLGRRAVSLSAANFSVIYLKDVCRSNRRRERMQTCA